ncbi:MAG: hypothetical protein ACLPZR_25130 [Solirubrobacteraceae bacterium]
MEAIVTAPGYARSPSWQPTRLARGVTRAKAIASSSSVHPAMRLRALSHPNPVAIEMR